MYENDIGRPGSGSGRLPSHSLLTSECADTGDQKIQTADGHRSSCSPLNGPKYLLREVSVAVTIVEDLQQFLISFASCYKQRE